MFLDDRHLDFKAFKYGRNGYETAAVYGSIYDFYLFAYLFDGFFGQRKFYEFVVITLFEMFVDNGKRCRIAATLYFFYFDFFNREVIGDRGNIFYDLFGVFDAHLRAVRAVNLIAVVFFGIMACGYHYTRETAEFSDRVREHRYRARRGIDINLYIVIQQHACRRAGKQFAFVTGIVRYGDALFHSGIAFRLNEFRKPLRSATNGINVHFIGTVSDYSAHTRRAEFEFRAESVFYRLVVAFHRAEFVKPLRIYIRTGKPVIVIYFIIHLNFPPKIPNRFQYTAFSSVCQKIYDVFNQISRLLFTFAPENVKINL